MKASLTEAPTTETVSLAGNVRELQHVGERAVILSDRKRFAIRFHAPHSGFRLPRGKKRKFNLEELENTIQEVLRHCSGNLTQAADLLGITRTSLYRRLNTD